MHISKPISKERGTYRKKKIEVRDTKEKRGSLGEPIGKGGLNSTSFCAALSHIFSSENMWQAQVVWERADQHGVVLGMVAQIIKKIWSKNIDF